jgi:hypothetical protein
MASNPTDMQWKHANSCETFSLTYTGKNNKSRGIKTHDSIPTSHYIFTAWHFNVGSFCLVRHEGIDGIPPEECTRDRYWKARIIEIRRPKRKKVSR